MQHRRMANFFITIAGIVFLAAGTLVFPARALCFWPWPLLEKKPIPAAQGLLRVKIPGTVSPPTTRAEAMARETAALATELIAHLAQADPDNGDLADGLLVTTFVDLKRLYRTSSFGRYLGEQLMGEMQRHGYRVLEIRKSRQVMIADRYGEYGLSRDPKAINTAIAAGAMLTGTYTPAGANMVVNARIVDNRSGEVLASATRIFVIDRVVKSMLADSSTPGRERSGVMYLQKLAM